VLTLLIVYLHYNALYIKLKLFALYNNIFFMKISKTENRFKTGFQQLKTGFQKNGFNIPSNNLLSSVHTITVKGHWSKGVSSAQ